MGHTAVRKSSNSLIYVAGNHEYYRYDYHKLLDEMREMVIGISVHLLENDVHDGNFIADVIVER